MTTIAYKEGILAADSQVTSGHIQSSSTFSKIKKFDEGYAAFSGLCSDISILFDLIKGREVEGETKNIDATAIVMPNEGKPYQASVDSLGNLYKHPINKFSAIGSGWTIAMGAMQSGASAKEAVKAAIKLDIYSGGAVKWKKKGQK